MINQVAAQRQLPRLLSSRWTNAFRSLPNTRQLITTNASDTNRMPQRQPFAALQPFYASTNHTRGSEQMRYRCAGMAPILCRGFSSTPARQRDHHFDTLKFVQRLKDEGFTEEQAVAMMKVLSDVIEER